MTRFVVAGFGSMKGTATKREAVNKFETIRNAQGQVIGNKTVLTIDESQVPANELSALDPTILGRAA